MRAGGGGIIGKTEGGKEFKIRISHQQVKLQG